jgi:hypothetical protein
MNLKSFGTAVKNVKDCTIYQQIWTPGKYTGTLVSVRPAYDYKMSDGSEPKAFDSSDIILLVKDKIEGQWVTKELPSVAFNLRHKSDTTNKVKYSSLVFRGITTEQLQREFIDNQKSGTKLGSQATALYGIISDNGLTVAEFSDHLTNGKPLSFAQYKRKNGATSYVDQPYYDGKFPTSDL